MSENTQTIDCWLRTHAEHQSESVALNFVDRAYSYKELSDWVEQLAGALQHGLQLKRGDRIAYYGKNSDTEVALIFAAARLGLIFSPLNWRLVPAELNYMLSDSGASVLFYDDEFADQIKAVSTGFNDMATISTFDRLAFIMGDFPPVQSNAKISDPLFIVYTSGTTGRPKGAVITQQAVFWNAIISSHAHDFTCRDHTLNVLPLFHVGGINIQMMPTFFVGGEVTLHPQFDIEAAIQALEYQGITVVISVPTVMKALLYHPDWGDLKLPTLRLVNTGSTDVPVEIIEEVHKRNIPMIQIYGATETGPISTYQKPGEAFSTVGSIGRCAAYSQIRLMDENGEVAQGEVGEIWVKGPNNFSHYWNNPDATKEAIVDGWFRTGDMAKVDENGLYWFADRLKHMIISGGENIYPAELERILNRIPGILEACIVGRPHPKWGEVPVAVVVTAENGPSREDILSAFSDKIARFKHPKDVIFLQSLPKNAMGKVLATEVRKIVREHN